MIDFLTILNIFFNITFTKLFCTESFWREYFSNRKKNCNLAQINHY